eukprot:g66192.t1
MSNNIADMDKVALQAFLKKQGFDDTVLRRVDDKDGKKILAVDKQMLKRTVGSHAGMKMYAILHPDEEKANAPPSRALEDMSAEGISAFLLSKGYTAEELANVKGMTGKQLMEIAKDTLKRTVGGHLGMRLYATLHPADAEPVQIKWAPPTSFSSYKVALQTAFLRLTRTTQVFLLKSGLKCHRHVFNFCSGTSGVFFMLKY